MVNKNNLLSTGNSELHITVNICRTSHSLCFNKYVNVQRIGATFISSVLRLLLGQHSLHLFIKGEINYAMQKRVQYSIRSTFKVQRKEKKYFCGTVVQNAKYVSYLTRQASFFKRNLQLIILNGAFSEKKITCSTAFFGVL